ncbi:ABC transporter substrate-binding protein [Cohnella rhizosphaerae]|uniref:ABC transporter substrate-binding protein n=1 Tax=Cohnella rhizosphaerae TaxID=1457232 RepID=A0A9X4QTI4_9BACL|nr:ABC transporter substrate-binding protein [Cohnella rhizosphaerae]MDG0810434.1 ABC transporter substrate-binding protein [Cohnella rhizosphaerae]
MRKLVSVSMVLVVALTLVLAGCSSKPSSPAASSSSTDTKGTAQSSANAGGSKHLTIAIPYDVQGFDIHNHNNTPTEAVHVNLFSYLVKKNEKQVIEPDLAVSWESIDDTTWRFVLRQGVKFHNGDPFTSADVKYTLERVSKDDKLLEYGNYKQIKEVKIVDEYTVDIITDGPQPALLNRLSRLGSGMLPSKYLEEQGWEKFQSNPIGTGPYKFKQWIRDDRLELVRNPDYVGDAPNWDEVTFRVIPEDATRVAELLTGGVDIAVNVPAIDMDRIESNEGTHAAATPTQRVIQLNVRTKEGTVTADPRVREAIDLAIDKQAIVDSIYMGAATPTRTRVTPGNFGAKADLFGTSLYDPERAKQLLKEAGYEKGLKLTFNASGDSSKDKETAELITAMLAEVGIEAKLELLENSAYQEKFRGRTFDELVLIPFGNSMFDAALAFSRISTQGAKGETDYSNAEVDRLLAAAETNMNAKEREQQYFKVQDIIAQERPFIYLFQENANFGISDRVEFSPRLDEMLYADQVTLK